MFKQEKENLKRLILELESPALLPELCGLQVDLKNAEAIKFSGMGERVHGRSRVKGEV
jgi:hypothetical protein